MVILGIDPGIGRMGWGIIEKIQNSHFAARRAEFRIQNYGCVETKSDLAIEDRLRTVYEKITEIVKEYKPDVLAIEELFFNTNAKTAFIVGEARGVVLLAASQKKLSVAVYTPLQVKTSITGYGRAEKAQIGQMVKVLLKLKEIPKPDDVSDALAVALTHAFYKKF
ncbi:MAG: crossover junction endodeoxyribonuclease RuvC [Candidatus Levybacteria bacterium]|nr:crossover junction endodeoxyribonuclease RuvC [Candidatus Levybacteria bacterium]